MYVTDVHGCSYYGNDWMSMILWNHVFHSPCFQGQHVLAKALFTGDWVSVCMYGGYVHVCVCVCVCVCITAHVIEGR